MTVPEWGRSVVRNYRAQYRERYGEECNISDDQIWHIFETVHDDTDSALQDEARVEKMREATQDN